MRVLQIYINMASLLTVHLGSLCHSKWHCSHLLVLEMIGVTAGETKDPQKTIPKAINAVPLRIFSILRWCISSNYVYYSLG